MIYSVITLCPLWNTVSPLITHVSFLNPSAVTGRVDVTTDSDVIPILSEETHLVFKDSILICEQKDVMLRATDELSALLYPTNIALDTLQVRCVTYKFLEQFYLLETKLLGE